MLLIEDEPTIRASLATALRSEGYTVHERGDGLGCEPLLPDTDLAIIDLGLPRGPDGLELARHIGSDYAIPVIILTAASDFETKGAGYRAGADLYVTKPFSLTELLWQVQALLRRTTRPAATLRAGPMQVDLVMKTAKHGDADLKLTPTEFELLTALVRHAGQVLSKPQLLRLVWGHTGHDTNLVEATIKRLRAKLRPHDPNAIQTVRGFGYRIEP